LSGGDEESTLNLLYNTSVPSVRQQSTCQYVVKLCRCSASQAKQDAQLLQRDRAPGCIISLAKSGRVELGVLLAYTVLAYADDIVLLCPTANAMRKMLQMCEEYARAYSVMFNAAKSKCIVCESTYKPKSSIPSTNVLFTINGSPVEVIDNWAHLGHVITHDSDDSLDILRCRDKPIGQINNVHFVSWTLCLK